MEYVKFYEEADLSKYDFKYAVIISRYHGKWLLCKAKTRDTYEVPAGHREEGEDIFDTAHRELYEETGALEYHLHEIGMYSVTKVEDGIEGQEVFGMLFFAEIYELGELPPFEMDKIELFDSFPPNLTYPSVQPLLLKRVQEKLGL